MKQKFITVALLSILPLSTLLKTDGLLSFFDYFFLWSKFSFLVALVLISSAPVANRRGVLIWSAVLVSYLTFLMIGPTSVVLEWWHVASLAFSFVFYSFLLLWSYWTLGQNFSVLPDRRKIVVDGIYKLTPHPIYLSCTLILAVYVSVYSSFENIVLFFLFLLAVLYRSHAESSLLSQDAEYKAYREGQSNWWSFLLGIPVLVTFVIVLLMPPRTSISLLRVSTNIPFYSLSPLTYDDWTSVFIGNHIWARLIPERQRDGVVSLLNGIKVSCVPETNCRRTKVVGKIQDVKDCTGRPIDKSQIVFELSSIVQHKKWILPGFSFCKSNDSTLCLEFDSRENVEERLRAVYFRFGWSRFNLDIPKGLTGASNYCLAGLSLKSDKLIDQAVLLVRDKHSTPASVLIDSNSNRFDVALFKDQPKEGQHIINASTPLAYYVLSNPRKSHLRLPWNTVKGRGLIANHLKKIDYIFDSQTLAKAVPHGSAIQDSQLQQKPSKISSDLNFILPSYITECDHLASILQDELKITAKCQDLSLLTQDVVVSNKDWDGFLSPLSPGAPYREAIYDQYFSGLSSDSWLKTTRDNNMSFYLVGIGRTELTVKSDRICGFNENYLGFSDLHVFDFKFCQ